MTAPSQDTHSPPTSSSSSVLITGANGSLGTAIALALCKSTPIPSTSTFTSPSPPQQPPHLILTARNPHDPSSQHLSTLLSALAPPPTFTWHALDLSNLSSIQSFTTDLQARISAGEFPRLGGVVNSAAVFSFVPFGDGDGDGKGRTGEGFDVAYGVNALAPLYLVRGLLGVLDRGAAVVNVASVAHHKGVVDYFHSAAAATTTGTAEVTATAVVHGKGSGNKLKRAEAKLGLKDAFTRYGSSKLLLVMLGYALQRRLDSEKPSRGIKIVALDPGGMSGDSRLNADTHWVLRAIQAVVSFLGPVVRMVDRSAINPPSVPAQTIAALLGRGREDKGVLGGKYFVLGEEVESSVLSRDVELQERVWRRAMGELGLNLDL